MYWTPAKMLLLSDVEKYSFANAANASWIFYITFSIKNAFEEPFHTIQMNSFI